jgi:hypothetical protein
MACLQGQLLVGTYMARLYVVTADGTVLSQQQPPARSKRISTICVRDRIAFINVDCDLYLFTLQGGTAGAR